MMNNNHPQGEAEASGTSPQIPRLEHVSQEVEEVEVDERIPLLSDSVDSKSKGKGKGKGKDGQGKGKGKEKKPFYRARPLW
jgi:hypothetical protein